MKNILFTGSAGYLGSNACFELLKSAEINHVVGVDIKNCADKLKDLKKYSHLISDIRSTKIFDCIEKEHVDVIVHSACILNPPRGMSVEEMEQIELGGLKNLLAASIKFNVKKFIFISSGAVYGYFPEHPELITEEYRLKGNPEFPYSYFKAKAEQLIAEFDEQNPNIKTLIFRPGTILGKNTNSPLTHYFNNKLIVGVKGFKSPFCFILDVDVSKAILQGCINLDLTGAYNLSGDGVMTLKEIAQQLNRKYIELPKKLYEHIIGILRFVRLSKFRPYQVNLMCYRPVLANQKLKTHFQHLPSKNSHEVFQIYKSSKTLNG